MRTICRDLGAALGAALVVVLATAGPAAAHGQLAESEPADGSAVAAPLEQVTLYFTELPSREATFVVTAPDGSQVQSAWRPGEPRPLAQPVKELNLVDGSWTPVSYDVGHAAVVPLTHLPAAGTYTVAYESTSSDGEEVTGTTTFAYRGPGTEPDAGVAPSPGGGVAADAVFPAVTAPEPEPAVAAPGVAGPGAPGAASVEQEAGSGSSTPVLIALGVGVAVVANVVVLALRRSRPAAPAPARAPGRGPRPASSGRGRSSRAPSRRPAGRTGARRR